MRDRAAPLFRNRYRIPSSRLKGWDYRRPGTYFVTICVLGRERCLSEIIDGEVVLSAQGEIVAREWLRLPVTYPRAKLDAWIIMPDHFHGLLILEPEAGEAASLGTIIGDFKSRATKDIRMSGRRHFAWQERFDDHVVTNLKELERIRDYIRQNPKRWQIKSRKP